MPFKEETNLIQNLAGLAKFLLSFCHVSFIRPDKDKLLASILKVHEEGVQTGDYLSPPLIEIRKSNLMFKC